VSDPELHPVAGAGNGALSEDISREMVGLYKLHSGKGPVRCRTYPQQELVTVVLGGGYTVSEQTLFEDGKWHEVRRARQTWQDTMEERFVEVIEGRTGLQFVLDPSAATDAARAEELTLLAWAKAVGREGRIDEAVALYRSVSPGPLHTRATEALAALLYTSSTHDAARGAHPTAILRLEQIVTLAPGTAHGRLAQQQLPFYQAGEARQLLPRGEILAVDLPGDLVQQRLGWVFVAEGHCVDRLLELSTL